MKKIVLILCGALMPLLLIGRHIAERMEREKRFWYIAALSKRI